MAYFGTRARLLIPRLWVGKKNGLKVFSRQFSVSCCWQVSDSPLFFSADGQETPGCSLKYPCVFTSQLLHRTFEGFLAAGAALYTQWKLLPTSITGHQVSFEGSNRDRRRTCPRYICQAIDATDSSNRDVGHQGTSLVRLGNQVSRLGFCSSQTGHTRPPRKDKTPNRVFRKKTVKQHVSLLQSGVGHLPFVWFPWRLQPPARTQWNGRWEQRIHLCNLMMINQSDRNLST